MCVNKESQIPFPVSMILKAMEDLKMSIKITEGKDIAKRQALLYIKEMQEKNILPIERAKMRIRISANQEILQAIKESLES